VRPTQYAIFMLLAASKLLPGWMCILPGVLLLTAGIAVVGMQRDGQIPAVALLALAALPGVLTKQFVNCVQLKNAMASLIAHDKKSRHASKPSKLE